MKTSILCLLFVAALVGRYVASASTITPDHRSSMVSIPLQFLEPPSASLNVQVQAIHLTDPRSASDLMFEPFTAALGRYADTSTMKIQMQASHLMLESPTASFETRAQAQAFTQQVQLSASHLMLKPTFRPPNYSIPPATQIAEKDRETISRVLLDELKSLARGHNKTFVRDYVADEDKDKLSLSDRIERRKKDVAILKRQLSKKTK